MKGKLLAVLELCQWKHVSGAMTLEAIKERYANVRALYSESLNEEKNAIGRRNIITHGHISFPMSFVFDIIYLLSEVERLENRVCNASRPVVKRQWISVYDGLPDIDTPVLVSLAVGGVAILKTGILCTQKPVRSWKGWVFLDGSILHDDDVTHWQPLPKMPE